MSVRAEDFNLMVGTNTASGSNISPPEVAVTLIGTVSVRRQYFQDPSDSNNICAPNDVVTAQFNNLADQWRKQTSHLSSIISMCTHPTYLAIIRMGKPVIRCILRDLEGEPDYWFFALEVLTGEKPVPEDFDGTLHERAQIWLEWAERSGYLAPYGNLRRFPLSHPTQIF